jgi:ectoine hydroxylase-related dioxygenase (phytanoyl-CoA dioxygenase family)
MASDESKSPPAQSTPRLEAGSAEALQYLDEHGYVVIANVASAEECQHAIDLFWKYATQPQLGAKRHHVDTWSQIPASIGTGVVFDYGIGQSEFLWYLRGLPKVREAFASIWGTSKLLTSFDGCGVFRPWHYNESWKSKASWWHVDQNMQKKPNRCCIQGLISLKDADAHTGSLQVRPASHKEFHNLNIPAYADFVRIPESHPILSRIPAKLVDCRAGDLILWDSRLIHCNTPATQPPRPPARKDQWELLRLVAYICMTPAEMAEDLTQLRQLRHDAFLNFVTTNHWPHEFNPSSEPPQASRANTLRLSQTQHELLYGLAPGEKYEHCGAA